MHLFVCESDLSSIKESLRKAHPKTRPTHRMEAAAKGFGFASFASFLAKLKTKSLPIVVDDQTYCAKLHVPSINEGSACRCLSRAVSRSMLRRVLDDFPELTLRGIDSIWQGVGNEMKLPKIDRERLFNERRLEASEGDWAADQFELAMIFLSHQNKTRSLNRKMSSYGLKHRAENLSREFGLFTNLGNYVSNGALIAAAIASGFEVRRVAPDSYNAFLNISMRTINASMGGENFSKESRRLVVHSMYNETGVMTASSA